MKYKYYLWWDDGIIHTVLENIQGPHEYGEIESEDAEEYTLKAIKWKDSSGGWVKSYTDTNLLSIKKDDKWIKNGRIKFFRTKPEVLVELL